MLAQANNDKQQQLKSVAEAMPANMLPMTTNTTSLTSLGRDHLPAG